MNWLVVSLLMFLMLVAGCARAPLETPPCGGYWFLDASGLIERSDHATGLRVCVTTRLHVCSVLSLSSIRLNDGFAAIPANDAAIIRDLTVDVMKRNTVLRRAHLALLAFPRLAHKSICHRVEIHYGPATGALRGVLIR